MNLVFSKRKGGMYRGIIKKKKAFFFSAGFFFVCVQQIQIWMFLLEWRIHSQFVKHGKM